MEQSACVRRGQAYERDDHEGNDEPEDCTDDDCTDAARQFEEEEEVEGFEDWNLDEDGDGEGLEQLEYDEDGIDEQRQDELPELIYTEACDADSGQAPCISLQRCGNRLPNLQASSPDGNVDAVRVMLLGVNDSGRPSVGIDLGYACTQPHSVSTSSSAGFGGLGGFGHSSPSASMSALPSTSAHNTSFTGSDSCENNSIFSPSPASSPARPGASISEEGSVPGGVGTIDVGRCSPTLSLSPGSTGILSRASTTRASRPASPFVFQRPFTPSKSPTLPNARKSFVFSEWAASNKQTFVFEGSHTVDMMAVDCDGMRHQPPCKFVPTKSLTMAVQDAEFVHKVLSELPGVNCDDGRIEGLLQSIRDRKAADDRPSTPQQQPPRLTTPIRPKLGIRPVQQQVPSAASVDTGA